MDPAVNYLNKHAAGNPLVPQAPADELKYVVIIPSYIETGLEHSLVSLFNARPPSEPVEVITIFNWPEDCSPENISLTRNALSSARAWAQENNSEKIRFYMAEVGFIPRKKAGVGYARKTGMDEAVRRFAQAGQKDGIIISFDADTLCEQNYFTAIEEHFKNFPKTDGCSIYFEHPMEGKEFPKKVYESVVQYELHMRYYLNAIKYSGFPNAFYTVGSAFAVRANSYCRQGGMNARQAGEDFYFLQKFFDLGNFTDLNSTKVIPSPRPSLRVPFGTGKAIDHLLTSGKPLHSYNPETFELLKTVFSTINHLYKQLSESGKADLSGFHELLREYLEEINFSDELHDIYENSSGYEAFEKRFYRYFNMFRILKFSRFARKSFRDLPVVECAQILLKKKEIPFKEGANEKELLTIFRGIDRDITCQR